MQGKSPLGDLGAKHGGSNSTGRCQENIEADKTVRILF